MPGVVRLNVKEASALVDLIESKGGNAEGLRAAIKDVSNPGNSKSSIFARDMFDEEYLEEMRAQSTIEHGTDLECLICHDKFDHLICGTCENCFREWMLSIKRSKNEIMASRRRPWR